MIDSGIILLKYWLEVSEEEQTRRLEARIDDGRKIWKLSPMDLKSYSRWYDYSRARDEMFAATDTSFAPWYVARTDDKQRARLNIITHLLSQIPYKSCRARRSSCRSGSRAASIARRLTRSSSSRTSTDPQRLSDASRGLTPTRSQAGTLRAAAGCGYNRLALGAANRNDGEDPVGDRAGARSFTRAA